MRVWLAWCAAVAVGCAAGRSSTPVTPSEEFMASFEAVQIDGGDAAGTVMISSMTDETGHTMIPRAASVPMDRMVHIWGPDHPAVPILFSARMAMRFSILAGFATQQKLPEEEAEAWAWKKMHEPARSESEPAQ